MLGASIGHHRAFFLFSWKLGHYLKADNVPYYDFQRLCLLKTSNFIYPLFSFYSAVQKIKEFQ